MICSTCRQDLPSGQFSPKRWIQTRHFAADLSLRVYKTPCRRGRAYVCHGCKRKKWAAKA